MFKSKYFLSLLWCSVDLDMATIQSSLSIKVKFDLLPNIAEHYLGNANACSVQICRVQGSDEPPHKRDTPNQNVWCA